jgi:hypothetical protein
MAISPWTKWLDVKIAPLPFEALAYGYEKRAKKEEEADKLYTDLEAEFSKLKAIKDIDTPKRDERLNLYRNMVSTLYDETRGNPAAMMSGLRQVKSKFMQDATYGDLGQMHQKAVALEQAQEDYKKSSMDGKFSGLDDFVYKAAIAQPLEQYAAMGGHGRDEKGLTTNLSLGAMPKLPEVFKILDEATSKWKATKYPMGLTPYYDPKTGAYTGYLVHGTKEFVSFDEVAKGVYSMGLNIPELRTVNKLVASSVDPSYTKQVAKGKDKQGNIVYETLTGPAAALHDFYAGIGQNLAQRESYEKYDYDYVYDQYAADQRKKEEEAATAPLAMSYQQEANDIDNVLKNIQNASLPYTTMTGEVDYEVVDETGQTIEVPKRIKVDRSSQQIYDALPVYDREVVNYVKSEIPTLASTPINNLTSNDWKIINDNIAKRKNVKVSSVVNGYKNATKAKQIGDMYNVQMENYTFYSPKTKNVIPGTQLRDEGWEVIAAQGTLSSDNTVPLNIPGAQKYSFAIPESVLVKSKDGTTQTLYVGKNDAELKQDFSTYIGPLIENMVLSANSMKMPIKFMDEANIIIAPAVLSADSKANPKLSFRIIRENGEVFQFENTTPADLRTSVLTLYSQSEPLRNIILSKLFQNQ